MLVDTYAAVKTSDGTRKRGRLLSNGEGELVLFGPNLAVDRFAITQLDLRSKLATLADGGTLRWQKVCACGMPASVKGAAARLLERLTV